MINSIHRIGSFTSSEIVALTKKDRSGKKFGEKALTYIEETNYERRLGRSLEDEVSARPLSWGTLMEKRAFQLLPIDYILTSQETKVHPEISYWAGSKDGWKNDEWKTIFDVKGPHTLKSFCQLVTPLYDGFAGIEAMNKIRDTHKDGDKYYFQLVSNAILDSAKYAELIIYMPYQSEIADIKMMAMNADGEDMAKYSWINFAKDDELPFIKDGGYYKNLNIIRFAVPEEDKKFLKEQVLEAGKMLIKI